MINKELFEGPVGNYCIARNTIKCFIARNTIKCLFIYVSTHCLETVK